MPTQPIVIYLPQAAELLAMPPKRLYELTRHRAQVRMPHPIPFFKLGKRIAFTRAGLEAWIITLQNGGSR